MRHLPHFLPKAAFTTFSTKSGIYHILVRNVAFTGLNVGNAPLLQFLMWGNAPLLLFSAKVADFAA